MNKIHAVLIIVLLISSCGKQKENPPVSRDKMQKVLLDIQLAESYSIGLNQDSIEAAKYDKNSDSLAVFYSEILNHYHLSFESFNKAMDWYKLHPSEMDSLLLGVIDELNRAKTKNGIEDKRTIPKDSIQTNEKKVDTKKIKKAGRFEMNVNKKKTKIDSALKISPLKPKSI